MLDWALGILDHLGYPGLLLLMALENVFPPIPSEAIMPLAGLSAARGQFTLPGVILAGVAGSVLGNLPLYLLGRRVGRERMRAWVVNHGRWLLLSGRDVDRADAWFDRHGWMAVGLGRLVPGVRSLISLPAGFAGMRALPFLISTVIGSAVWCGLLAALGFWFSGYVERLGRWIDVLSWGVLGVVALVVGLGIRRRLREGRAR
ncbi:MAG: DedA family protein [Planctomycetes bacterium]|nr:DedA family protein [Planctomycetota bacterium]